jgi:hypothetical protein
MTSNNLTKEGPKMDAKKSVLDEIATILVDLDGSSTPEQVCAWLRRRYLDGGDIATYVLWYLDLVEAGSPAAEEMERVMRTVVYRADEDYTPGVILDDEDDKEDEDEEGQG